MMTCMMMKKTNKVYKGLKRTKLNKRSNKQKQKDSEYSKLRLDFLLEHSLCEARLPSCSLTATDVHHKKRRGIYMLDITTWMAVCRSCHSWIEANPVLARQLNFLD